MAASKSASVGLTYVNILKVSEYLTVIRSDKRYGTSILVARNKMKKYYSDKSIAYIIFAADLFLIVPIRQTCTVYISCVAP